jgi:hypothetical protein
MTAEQRSERRQYLSERAAVTGRVFAAPEQQSRRERESTPSAFRDLLVSLARLVACASV